jgi:ArsR family transcriptional regulator, arsenate/arsenite/antimonite-responsive transcriptional repressor
MADIFTVIADRTRRDILGILLDRHIESEDRTGGMSVSEMVAQLELSQPTVSKHLKVLRDSGLVSVREMGQHRFYSLDYAPLEQVEDWLIPFLSADFDSSMIDEDETLPEGAGESGAGVTAASGTAGVAGSAGSALGEDVAATAVALGRVIADTRHQVKNVAHEISAGVSDGANKVKTVFRRGVRD